MAHKSRSMCCIINAGVIERRLDLMCNNNQLQIDLAKDTKVGVSLSQMIFEKKQFTHFWFNIILQHHMWLKGWHFTHLRLDPSCLVLSLKGPIQFIEVGPLWGRFRVHLLHNKSHTWLFGCYLLVQTYESLGVKDLRVVVRGKKSLLVQVVA